MLSHYEVKNASAVLDNIYFYYDVNKLCFYGDNRANDENNRLKKVF